MYDMSEFSKWKVQAGISVFDNAYNNHVWGQISNQVSDQVWNQVRNQVWDQVDNQVSNQIRFQIKENTH
jgi:hypothetical protein